MGFCVVCRLFIYDMWWLNIFDMLYIFYIVVHRFLTIVHTQRPGGEFNGYVSTFIVRDLGVWFGEN